MTAIEHPPVQSAPRSARADQLRRTIAPFLAFFNGTYAELEKLPDVANFAVGNPQELAMPGYVDALRAHLEPRDKDWFAYKMSEPNAQRAVARRLGTVTGLDWDAADVAMTNGGFAAIAIALRTLLEPGDEAVFLSPPWFCYEMLILAAGGAPVRVNLPPPGLTLDLAAIEAAVTPRTRVMLLNGPHNPSGRVYTVDELSALADLLTRVSERHGNLVYLLSDEPYRRIVFDGRAFHSPAEFYPRTVITYSYGKQLLAPGMRIGYLTWPPTMPDREPLREDTFIQQCATGWAFPNADLQHAIDDLERLCIDVGAMERRRDRFVGALREIGYEATSPEGTFYSMVRSPIDDDVRFSDLLAGQRVLAMPGTVVELPGWLRISLTASDEMVERGIPGFAAAWRAARAGASGG